jgi:hypothetical protein
VGIKIRADRWAGRQTISDETQNSSTLTAIDPNVPGKVTPVSSVVATVGYPGRAASAWIPNVIGGNSKTSRNCRRGGISFTSSRTTTEDVMTAWPLINAHQIGKPHSLSGCEP